MLKSEQCGTGVSIALTKLAPPKAGRTLVGRAPLIAHLEDGGVRPLTVVRAPAGYGKTTLLAQWRKQLLEQGKTVCWLSLDPINVQEASFVSYLVASLKYGGCDVGDGALEVYNHSPDNRMGFVITLANELLRSGADAYLLIDDAHLIAEQGTADVLEQLVAYAPANLHIVAGTRAELPLPLSSLRLHNQVTEVLAEQLRFSFADSVAFMGHRLKAALSLEQIRDLHDRTEGWAAALEMAAIALNRAGGDAYLTVMDGKPLLAASQMAADIVARLPQRTRRFLIEIAILHRLHPGLCEQVTGVAEAAMLLKELSEQHLFILQVEGSSEYRFHPLFSEHLKSMLEAEQPQDARQLHERAAAWYLEHHATEEAIGHLIAAGNDVQASALIERHGLGLVQSGCYGQVLSWFDQLGGDDQARSWTIQLARMYALGNMGRTPELRLALADAKARFTEPAQRRMLVAVDTMTACYQDDPAAIFAAGEQWLALWRQDQSGIDASEAVTAAMGLAYAHLHDGQPEQAHDMLLMTARFSSDALPRALQVHKASITVLAFLYQGNMPRARKTAADMLAAIERQESRRAVLACQMAGLCAAALYEMNLPDKVIEVLSGRMDVIREACHIDATIMAHACLARTLACRGDVNGAIELLDALRYQGEARQLPRAVVVSACERTRLLLWRGELRAVQPLCTQLAALARQFGGTRDEVSLLIRATLLRVQLAGAGAGGTGPDACAEAAALVERCGALQFNGMAIAARLLLARACRQAGARDDADAALMAAVDAARAAGMVRVLLDDDAATVAALRALAAAPDGAFMIRNGVFLAGLLPAPQAAPEHAATDAGVSGFARDLTQREMDILRQLVLGLPNKRIAIILNMSEGTVKWHVRNLLEKTGTGSRNQVADLARRNGFK